MCMLGRVEGTVLQLQPDRQGRVLRQIQRDLSHRPTQHLQIMKLIYFVSQKFRLQNSPRLLPRLHGYVSVTQLHDSMPVYSNIRLKMTSHREPNLLEPLCLRVFRFELQVVVKYDTSSVVHTDRRGHSIFLRIACKIYQTKIAMLHNYLVRPAAAHHHHYRNWIQTSHYHHCPPHS